MLLVSRISWVPFTQLVKATEVRVLKVRSSLPAASFPSVPYLDGHIMSVHAIFLRITPRR